MAANQKPIFQITFVQDVVVAQTDPERSFYLFLRRLLHSKINEFAVYIQQMDLFNWIDAA